MWTENGQSVKLGASSPTSNPEETSIMAHRAPTPPGDLPNLSYSSPTLPRRFLFWSKVLLYVYSRLAFKLLVVPRPQHPLYWT